MMLSIELSSRRGSVAVWDGRKAVAQEQWDEPMARHPLVFEAVPRVLAKAGGDWRQVTAFVAGRGPGAFSGVRVGLVAAQAFALPNRTQVYAFSSGAALALDLAAEAGVQPIVIAGDARRGAIWHAIFVKQGSGIQKVRDWGLSPAGDFIPTLPSGAWVASPDWARLQSAVGELDPRFHWVTEDRFPSASRLAELAWQAMTSGTPSEPLDPLYLHPAV